jgi:hypothetical protein
MKEKLGNKRWSLDEQTTTILFLGIFVAICLCVGIMKIL